MTLRTLTARLSLGIWALLIPTSAHAQGGAAISGIFSELLDRAQPLWIVVAVLVIVVAGFSLMISQDEGRIGKAKSTIVAAIIGGILITIGPKRLVSFIYTGAPGFVVPSAGNAFGGEAVGVSQWLATLVAVLGLLMMIIALIQAALSFGSDEGAYSKVRTALIQLVLGLLTISAAFIIRSVMFDVHEPMPLLEFILGKLVIVLAVILTVAVAVLVYAGARMIISTGQEDQFGAAKSLAIRVGVGIIVILLSFVMIWTVYTVLT